MKNAFLAASAILALGSPVAFAADTQWNSPASTAYGTAVNWTNGVPGATITAYFVNNSTYQHHLQTFGGTWTDLSIYFASGSGSAGFIIDDGGAAAQFNLRAGGTANGIFNADSFNQTISAPITMFSANGFTGNSASQTWKPAGGGLIIIGVYNGTANTINNYGG